MNNEVAVLPNGFIMVDTPEAWRVREDTLKSFVDEIARGTDQGRAHRVVLRAITIAALAGRDDLVVQWAHLVAPAVWPNSGGRSQG